MRESTTLSNRVSVMFFYDGDEDYARPVRLLWHSRDIELAPVKFWHTTRHDGQLLHHYTVDSADGEMSFQLALETENLTWTLERVTADDAAAYEPAVTRRLFGAMAQAAGR